MLPWTIIIVPSTITHKCTWSRLPLLTFKSIQLRWCSCGLPPSCVMKHHVSCGESRANANANHVRCAHSFVTNPLRCE